jgi:hypothetical protein
MLAVNDGAIVSRISNGEQSLMLINAGLHAPVSRRRKGYLQLATA